ncbi:CUE domain protein [Dictyocaulus viviparus]|uniref:CUE domain protein n=1 Tax=Dictyocaulus viviparus TaxID=29172 RepID=A0A0D8XRQ1_DICVI|nr:CUE domain protein [Dictyocaulus viviparus]
MSAQPTEELLEFETAMKDFSMMFPAISRDEIERMLRKNDGDVAGTVDDLLLLSLESTQLSNTATSASSRSQSVPSSGKSVSFPSSPRRTTDNNMMSTSLNTKSFRVSRLSADQVSQERARIEMLKKENERRLDTVCDEKEARMLEDEQLALLMQNKEFIRWLRKDQLLHSSYISSSSPNMGKSLRKRYSMSKEHGPRVPEGPVVDELIINAESDLKNRLKNMSRTSKERLLQLAARFRRNSDTHLNAL